MISYKCKLSLFAMAASVAMALSGCGGGGGVTPMTDSGGAPMTGGGTPPTYGIPSDVAEIAAKATPARGSVTQSSNAIGGVTQDRASVVHEADGTLTLRVSRGNARTWDISTGDDVNLIESDNSPNAILDASIREFVIERELWGGATEYVGMITTKRANDALHPGTREFHVGDTIDVDLHGQGNLYVVDSIFNAQGEDYFRDSGGSQCISETGQCRVDPNGMVTEGTLRLNVGGSITVVQSWDDADSDYISLGYWLRVPDASDQVMRPEFGLVVDGGHPFTEFAGLSGTASYGGYISAFAFGDSTDADVAPFLLPSSEGEGQPQLFGTVTLTADFGANTIGGRVSLEADPDNFDNPGDPQAPPPLVLTLGNSPIDESLPGGFFTGDTSSHADSSVAGLSGKWGGQFFGTPDPDRSDQPPIVGGTFGAQKEGFAVLGAFLGINGVSPAGL